MEHKECPYCGMPLAGGVAVCRECGKEVAGVDQEPTVPKPEEEKHSRNTIYAILAVFLVVVGGAVLLMFAGLLPNPLKGGSTIAIVNGEKISSAELNQKLEMYKRIYGQSGKMDFTTPEGKKILEDIRNQILHNLIQERVLMTEAVKEKITVSPQMITDRIAAAKKGLNLSDKDFEEFLKNHGMSLADFTKRLEREAVMTQLIDKGTKEKGLTKEDWINELNKRAKVEMVNK